MPYRYLLAMLAKLRAWPAWVFFWGVVFQAISNLKDAWEMYSLFIDKLPVIGDWLSSAALWFNDNQWTVFILFPLALAWLAKELLMPLGIIWPPIKASRLGSHAFILNQQIPVLKTTTKQINKQYTSMLNDIRKLEHSFNFIQSSLILSGRHTLPTTQSRLAAFMLGRFNHSLSKSTKEIRITSPKFLIANECLVKEYDESADGAIDNPGWGIIWGTQFMGYKAQSLRNVLQAFMSSAAQVRERLDANGPKNTQLIALIDEFLNTSKAACESLAPIIQAKDITSKYCM